MARTRATAKQAGSTFERQIADYLAATYDDRIDRRVKTGSKDKGDIANIRTLRGGRVVAECKNYGGQFQVGPWLREAEIERANDDAVAGVVIAKKRGTAKPGEQVVFMTMEAFVTLLKGGLDEQRVYEVAPEVRAASLDAVAHISQAAGLYDGDKF